MWLAVPSWSREMSFSSARPMAERSVESSTRLLLTLEITSMWADVADSVGDDTAGGEGTSP
jgi:hypothetical protein